MQVQQISQRISKAWSACQSLGQTILHVHHLLLGAVVWVAIAFTLVECSSDYIEQHESNLASQLLQETGFDVATLNAFLAEGFSLTTNTLGLLPHSLPDSPHAPVSAQTLLAYGTPNLPVSQQVQPQLVTGQEHGTADKAVVNKSVPHSLTEHNLVEHKSIANTPVEHSRVEDKSTAHSPLEHNLVEDNSIANKSVPNNPVAHNLAEHKSIANTPVEHSLAEHNLAAHQSREESKLTATPKALSAHAIKVDSKQPHAALPHAVNYDQQLNSQLQPQTNLATQTQLPQTQSGFTALLPQGQHTPPNLASHTQHGQQSQSTLVNTQHPTPLNLASHAQHGQQPQRTWDNGKHPTPPTASLAQGQQALATSCTERSCPQITHNLPQVKLDLARLSQIRMPQSLAEGAQLQEHLVQSKAIQLLPRHTQAPTHKTTPQHSVTPAVPAARPLASSLPLSVSLQQVEPTATQLTPAQAEALFAVDPLAAILGQEPNSSAHATLASGSAMLQAIIESKPFPQTQRDDLATTSPITQLLAAMGHELPTVHHTSAQEPVPTHVPAQHNMNTQQDLAPQHNMSAQHNVSDQHNQATQHNMVDPSNLSLAQHASASSHASASAHLSTSHEQSSHQPTSSLEYISLSTLRTLAGATLNSAQSQRVAQGASSRPMATSPLKSYTEAETGFAPNSHTTPVSHSLGNSVAPHLATTLASRALSQHFAPSTNAPLAQESIKVDFTALSLPVSTPLHASQSQQVIALLKTQLCRQGVCEQDYAQQPEQYQALLNQCLAQWSTLRHKEPAVLAQRQSRLLHAPTEFKPLLLNMEPSAPHATTPPIQHTSVELYPALAGTQQKTQVNSAPSPRNPQSARRTTQASPQHAPVNMRTAQTEVPTTSTTASQSTPPANTARVPSSAALPYARIEDKTSVAEEILSRAEHTQDVVERTQDVAEHTQLLAQDARALAQTQDTPPHVTSNRVAHAKSSREPQTASRKVPHAVASSAPLTPAQTPSLPAHLIHSSKAEIMERYGLLGEYKWQQIQKLKAQQPAA